MSYQDEKCDYIEQARFKYEELSTLIEKYSPLVRISPALQTIFDAYGEGAGITAAEQFERDLRRCYEDIKVDSWELQRQINRVILYDDYRAERKYQEFEGLMKKMKKSQMEVQLPSELGDAWVSCQKNPAIKIFIVWKML